MSNYFPSLYGNRKAAARLGALIKNNSLPHALLIEGPVGSGKMTLATLLAAALSCQNASKDVPCGLCPFCQKIMRGLSPDVSVTKCEGDRATIGIEQIRSIRMDMHLSATESPCKVYVIRDAETMTPEAQNALLVNLEEPPAGVYIFLLCENTDTLLTTVKSRVQPIRMQSFDRDELLAYAHANLPAAAVLERESADDFRLALTAANGSIGVLRSLLDRSRLSSLSKMRATTDAILDALFLNRAFPPLFDAFSMLPTGKRQEFLQYILLLLSAIRDLITAKATNDAPMLYYTAREKAEIHAETKSLHCLMSCYDILSGAAEDCAKNSNLNLTGAMLLSSLRAAR